MDRRTFLRTGIAGIAAISLPGYAPALAAPSHGSEPLTKHNIRKVELIDADWKFSRNPALKDAVNITDWLWITGTPDQEEEMIGSKVDVSNWQKTSPGVSTVPEFSYGWFRTELPNIHGPGRVIHFEAVDDTATVYLNGKKLASHDGWDEPFDVPLDSVWNTNGPNVLVVLVRNNSNQGGMTSLVRLGILKARNFEENRFDDSTWRTVHLPHDYVVEGEFDSHSDVGHGSLPWMPAWYRKKLHIPASDKGKRIWLYFEGVFRNATIYLNGKKVFFQEDGYDPFNVDITEAVSYGGENLLAVHVDPKSEGWWYEGGGIYRHVWLNVASPIHVAPWGVYVISDVNNITSAPSAGLTILTRISNTGKVNQHITVTTTILAPDGQPVGKAKNTITAASGIDTEISQQVTIKDAKLWSLEKRNLYTAVTEIHANERIIDDHRQRFGIRTLRFDPNDGFFLNEKPVKLHGTCNHQDFVGVGIAMPDSILRWRMQRLKDDLGCNAIRCSHNPMSPAMYDACDELGLLVMDETRHPGDVVAGKAYQGVSYSRTEHIEKMIMRDRNHPSVIMWSMANEEWAVQQSPFGAQMLKALMEAVRKHDCTRPITTAVNSGTDEGWMVGFGSVEDLLGVNYNYQDYDFLHKRYPNKPVLGSETASDTSCRGIYKTDDNAAHLTSYMTPEGSWRPLAERKFVMGGFVWTGFDYRGEPTPYGWPEINSNFGLLDMCGFPKDAAYYYKAWWKEDEPLVHIFPHWNWAGREGQPVPVWCFSNCDRVELFLNGVSQGIQDMPRYGHVQWDKVTYQPGTLKAVGYRNGQIAAKTSVETTGDPAAIRLIADRSTLTADGEDIIPVKVEIVDKFGAVVPTANNSVKFTITGAATNAGVGNGDPSSHEPNQADYRSAFNGLCMVLVRATAKPGSIELCASGEGLTEARLRFTSQK